MNGVEKQNALFRCVINLYFIFLLLFLLLLLFFFLLLFSSFTMSPPLPCPAQRGACRVHVPCVACVGEGVSVFMERGLST